MQQKAVTGLQQRLTHTVLHSAEKKGEKQKKKKKGEKYHQTSALKSQHSSCCFRSLFVP